MIAVCASGLIALVLSAVTARAGEPRDTQHFTLVPGWNAIYLNVQPADSDPAAVFRGLPVVSVWTRGFETGGPEFIENPDEVLRPELKPPGWIVYVPAGQPDSHLSSLVSIQANRAFLVRLAQEASPVDLFVTGRPLVPFINWQPAAFNLVGFPIDDASAPTFASYFASSEALREQPVYRLLSTGVWARIAVPDAARMKYGEAYQVYAATGTHFIAPLALDIPTTDGLAYGRIVTEHKLRITNLSGAPATVEVEALGQPDTVPLSFWRIRTEAPGVGTFEWPPLPSPHTIALNAGVSRTLRLSVRREEFAADQLGTVLSVRDGRGTRWLLPVTAAKVDGPAGSGAATTAATAPAPSEFAGLWVGNAIVSRVSQPNISQPEPVGAVPGENVCEGGSRVGKSCPNGNADCPVLCAFRCVGGANAGAPCTPGVPDACGSDGECPVPAARCAGGVNAGLSCSSSPPACASGERVGQPCTVETQATDCPGSTCKEDCPGSRCGGLTDRCKGGPRAGGLCDAAEGNDCPNGACAEVLRCANNHQVECTRENAGVYCPGSTCEPIRLCTSGDNIGASCDAHDCPAGVCTPPDDRCLGGSMSGAMCETDDDCPESSCNTRTRCMGGPHDGAACGSAEECGVASCTPPSGQASEFPLRLILHVDAGGKVSFLKQVIQMWQDGTTKRDADDPEARVVDRPGHLVLLTDDELIPSFQGATLRDGVPVGRRLSTAAFDFPGNELEMSPPGGFGCGSGTLTATINLDRNFPTNPYRHPFHPDHDNLSGGASNICHGGRKASAPCTNDADCPDGRCEEVEEAFNITRVITLDFASPGSGDTRHPGSCVDAVEGEYRETISGLHHNPINVAGSFKLNRVDMTPKLNPQPQ